jgi:hypothetical protein
MPEQSTGALTGPRSMVVDIPEYLETYTTLFPSYKGWYNAGLTNCIAYETYLDLSGYELDDLTFVPTGGSLQDPGRYSYTLNTPGAPVENDFEILDIVSQERLDLTNIDADLTLLNVPGMMLSTNNFTQITIGQYRALVVPTTQATALDLMQVVTGGSFGSADPVVVQKLWVYRIVRVNGSKSSGDILAVPASRFVVNGTVIKEKDLIYMQRLKRSYELQG